MYTRLVAKVLITLMTIYYVYVPASADLNESHLLNPDWSPHSRVHLVWFLVFALFAGIIAIYLVWAKDEPIIGAFIGLGFTSGFLVAAFTASSYGGSLSDSVGEVSQGIPINLMENGVMWLIFAFLIGYLFLTGSPQVEAVQDEQLAAGD